MQITEIMGIINGILASPNRVLVITWLFLGSAVWYLYDQNITLHNSLDVINVTNQLSMNKATENCEDQLKINRQKFQVQLDVFTDKTNKDRDSTNLYFYNELRKANLKISEKIEKIQ